jgi:hypothetical protein
VPRQPSFRHHVDRLAVEPGADVVGSKNWSELEFSVLA